MDAEVLRRVQIEEGTAETVDRLVESVLSGQVEDDRVQTEEGTAPPRLTWPEDCPDCGARMEPAVKGQTRIVCEYCGRTVLVQTG